MPRSQTADEVARARAQAALGPYFAEIERQRQAAALRDQQQAASIQGMSLAAAEALKGTGQQVQQGYDLAAQRQSNYAKGFSIGMQQATQGNADQANQLLAQQGSPQQVQSQGTAGADVLYGLGGYIPASTLNREGAAFGAAASMLPSTQLGYGQQALAKQRQEAANREADYDAQRLKVESERPGIIQQALADIRTNNLTRQQLAQQQKAAKAQAIKDERDFRFKAAIAEREYGLKAGALDLRAQNQTFTQRATSARIRNETKRVQAQVDRDLRNAGIQDEKLAQGWANIEIRAKQTGRKKGAKGLTAKQRSDFRGTATQIADSAFNGLENDPTTPEDDSAPPIGYQDALREMYKEGVPLAIAQQALNQLYRPGQRGRPVVGFQERQRRKRASGRASQGARKAPR